MDECLMDGWMVTTKTMTKMMRMNGHEGTTMDGHDDNDDDDDDMYGGSAQVGRDRCSGLEHPGSWGHRWALAGFEALGSGRAGSLFRS
eukprot:612785-Karenia_brevis.AAC.1